MKNSLDLQFALNVAQEAAQAGSLVLKKYFGQISVFQQKDDESLVSIADQESEEAIRKVIFKYFPDCGIIGEEGGETKADADMLWAIDPLDGTNNFLHANSNFCIAMGLRYKGEWVLAYVYAPILEQKFHAIKNQGAYFQNQKVQVSKRDKLQDSMIDCCRFFADKKITTENLRKIADVLSGVRAFRSLGSAALEMAYVSCGIFDVFFARGLKIWDTAGAMLLIQEAGGKVTDFSMAPFSPGMDECFASNALLHSQAYDQIIRLY